MSSFRFLLNFTLKILLVLSLFGVSVMSADLKFLKLHLKHGNVYIKLNSDIAPNHVKRIIELTKNKFYDGVVFHRVIDGFMAQTGDPTGTGMGGSGVKLKAEFNNAKHIRGSVSMARAMDPNSADSQFFIVLKDSLFLDKQYTVFGEVVSGMEYVDMIKKGDKSQNGSVTNPDKIIDAKIVDNIGDN
jgi:peptidylprolyl isomerase